METWNTRAAQSFEVKVSGGILMKLVSKYNHKSWLFWCFLAARRINETVKKPSLRSAVAYYQQKAGTSNLIYLS